MSEWGDLNSRPSDPQDRIAEIFKHKTKVAIDTYIDKTEPEILDEDIDKVLGK
ncbi:hypothetical protein JYT36_00760 [Bacteroidales bacterium AH-315-N07]|nr:hypothetical protein [Bacteroidales bacterium AH-315-N07]